MRRALPIVLCALVAPSAFAGDNAGSLEDRANMVRKALKKNQTYEARLATEYANNALAELNQNDIDGARLFVERAEALMGRIGGGK